MSGLSMKKHSTPTPKRIILFKKEIWWRLSVTNMNEMNSKNWPEFANFLVEWKSEKSVNPPFVESVMIGAEGQQGISFASRGQVITTAN